MSQSLAVKYRPTDFDSVVSQESIIKILKRQLEIGDVKNTYLFCGASGCGKTTVARAFANAINEGIGSPIEIDGASNNGVDNVKQIIKSASERSIDSKYKVYIIDECHALSNAAWQAFLKCIEEPPTYTIFIFATTDPQKIPSTILNRVMRFNFTRIDSSKIRDRLMYICNQEHFLNYEDACDYISRISNNQMRDAIATLEKCADYNNDLNIENVMNAIGSYSYDVFFDLVNFIIDGKTDNVIDILTYLYNKGNDIKLFVDQFLSFVLDICKYCICKTYNVTKLPFSYETRLKGSTNFDFPEKYYCYLSDRLLELKNMLKNDITPRDTVEVFFIKMCRGQ